MVKRSVAVARHKTSVSLEDAFWRGLREIALQRGLPVSALIEMIDADRKGGNLSSAIRLFVLGVYRQRVGPKTKRKDTAA